MLSLIEHEKRFLTLGLVVTPLKFYSAYRLIEVDMDVKQAGAHKTYMYI